MILILFVDHERINYYWVFVLVDSLLILYGCVFEFFFFFFCLSLASPSLKSWVCPGLELGWKLVWARHGDWRGCGVAW